jgi:tetratricopeptide (TPR) repeat protein
MNIEDTIERIRAAHGNPQKRALATVEIVLAAHEPGLRAALEAAAVPHWFTPAILRAMLETDESGTRRYFEDLTQLPMVETFAAREGWNVHELTRIALRANLIENNPDHFQQLSVRAASCFGGKEPHQLIEAIYHRLIAAPEQAVGELTALYNSWSGGGRQELLQALGIALAELLKAAPLAPLARAQSLLRYGQMSIDRRPGSELEPLVKEAVALFQGSGDEFGEAVAHDLLGDIFYDRGQLAEAFEEFAAHQQIVRTLNGRNPEDTLLRGELAVSHNKAGSIYERQKRPEEALREYEAAWKIRMQLVSQEPDNPDWQRDLSISHGNLGCIYQAQGRIEEALRQCEADKRIMQKLAQQDPDNTKWQRDLSFCHNSVGRIYESQNRAEDALREYQEARRVVLALAQGDPGKTLWQRDLSVSDNNVGGILESLGDLSGATAMYRQGLELIERLLKLDPTNHRWQWDKEFSQRQLNRVQEKPDLRV